MTRFSDKFAQNETTTSLSKTVPLRTKDYICKQTIYEAILPVPRDREGTRCHGSFGTAKWGIVITIGNKQTNYK
jgi:hypothetical protein